MKLVATLKATIDGLDSTFTKAKDQILELARTLDESKQCERSRISRKIKDLLQDKIKEGKITSKWIHDCLPSEYKREYTKREVTSLLAEAGKAEEIIELSSQSDGTTLTQEAVEGNDNKPTSQREESYELALPQKNFQSTPGSKTDANLCSTSNESELQATAFVVFEFFMPLEEVRRYMEPIFRETAGRGNAWFHGKLDIRTGRVTEVSTGRAVGGNQKRCITI